MEPSLKNACCPTDVKPAINDYKGIGQRVPLEGYFDLYITGQGSQAIMLVYDVFGLTPNAEQLADALGSQDFLVVIPDFYKGDPWPIENIPPKADGAFPKEATPADGVDPLINWIMTSDACKMDRTKEVAAVKDYMVKNFGIAKMGAVGMCWGAKVCFNAAKAEGLIDAVAACHGSFLTKQDAEEVQVPICMLNSNEEPETYATEIKPVVEAKPKSVYKDFPTMHHGWMGSRGLSAMTDFNKPEQVERYQEGVTDLVNFFRNAMA